MLTLLFYDDRCKHSRRFMFLVEKYQLKNLFICIPIFNPDSGQKHSYVTKYRLTKIPSIVNNEKVLQGSDAFRWLNNMINQAQQNPAVTQNTRNNREQTGRALVRNNNQYDKVQAYQQIKNFADGYITVARPTTTGILTPQVHEIDDYEQFRGNFSLPQDNLTNVVTDRNFNSKIERMDRDRLKKKQLTNKFEELLAERGYNTNAQQRI